MKLGPELQALLRQIEAGGVPLLQADGAPMVLAKLPTSKRLTNVPIGYGEMELNHYEPEGPVVRMVFRVFDQPANPIVFDAFINPNTPADRKLLEQMATAPYLYFHGFGVGAMLPYLGSKRLDWKPEHRRGAEAILAQTQNTVTQWPAAKERWMRETDL